MMVAIMGDTLNFSDISSTTGPGSGFSSHLADATGVSNFYV